jgi:hypothetical protein
MLHLLEYCDPRVSKCFGCGGDMKPNGNVPEVPNNMVIVSRARRRYVQNGEYKTSPGLSNVYFHFNIACVKLHNQYFLPAFLVVPQDLKRHLTDIHKNILSQLDIKL